MALSPPRSFYVKMMFWNGTARDVDDRLVSLKIDGVGKSQKWQKLVSQPSKPAKPLRHASDRSCHVCLASSQRPVSRWSILRHPISILPWLHLGFVGFCIQISEHPVASIIQRDDGNEFDCLESRRFYVASNLKLDASSYIIFK